MKKQASIKTLKRKLDDIFSVYIRLRDADANGIIRCYCCGKPHHWKRSENMHFIPRQHMSLRFSEINCHGGCTYCNHYNNGNIEAYTLHLEKEYGKDIVKQLVIAKNQTCKITAFEYEAMIKIYTDRANELKNKKNI